MKRTLKLLLRGDPNPSEIASLSEWWSRHRDTLRLGLDTPVDVALAAGFAADRLGYAFASGYQVAGAAMFGRPDKLVAFCATEEGGAHPRAIRTTLAPDGDGYRLDGAKTFVTLGSHAELLAIVAGEGVDAEGRNRLKLAVIDADREGVVMEGGAATPFAPEIPHARLRLDRVAVAAGAILDGDGYDRYLKPFRTVEDCHIHAALLGYLVQLARRHAWPPEDIEALLASAVAIRAVALADPTSAAVHLALAGVLDQTRRLLDRLEPRLAAIDQPARDRWQRDRPLLEVAGRARALRREAAWRAFV